jgi:uncharacterized membrane protein YfcA
MMWEALAWAVLLLAGVAVGATSIGGVLVVPVLTLMLGYDMPLAIAAASLTFLITGMFSLWLNPQGWRGMRLGDPLLLGFSLLGAVLGACVADLVPAVWVRRWIGVLALGSGLQTLWRVAQWSHPAQAALRDWPTVMEQSWVGMFIGVGSALSGTGGPVMLMPYLLLTRRELMRSVSTALILQVPIGLASSATHAWAGRSQVGLSLQLAGVLVVGIWGGRWLARRSPLRWLMGVMASVLVATGGWLLLT